MKIYFDSKDINCKCPFGAISENDKLTFSIYAQDGVFIEKVYLKMINDDTQEVKYSFPLEYISTNDGCSKFSVKIDKLDIGLYWYYFEVYTEYGLEYVSNNNENYQLTVYSKDYKTPDLFKGGIIYHIFVDRFNKGKDDSIEFKKSGVLKNWNDPLTLNDADGVYRANDFYGGNFQGIIDKLDYFKSLNVTALYLSPIFKSSSTHRYDTADYMNVDELLGNEEKFKELLDKAHNKGISIILDGVFNHTGADSIYFNKFNNFNSLGAYQSKESPYYDWYTFYDFPNDYHCWWGVTVCPTIKPTKNGFRDLIINDVIPKWTNMGVDGWRLDVVDELNEEFVVNIRKAIKKSNKNAVMIGEVWEDASNKIAYDYRRHYFQGLELDGVMNYVFKVAILNYVLGSSVKDFKTAVDNIIENYPKQSLDVSMNLIGSHDTKRVLTYLANINEYNNATKEEKRDYRLNKDLYDLAKKRLKIASAIQFMLPGIPSIYYGDEIGLQGFEDPMNRETIKWDSIDEEIYNHYKILGNIRTQFKNEILGDTIIEDKNNILVLKRIAKNTITLIANTSDSQIGFYLDSNKKDILTHKTMEQGRIIIYPNSIYIFIDE